MPIYDQRNVLFPPRQADPGIQQILHTGQAAIATKGGRIFGIFKPVIGLSINRAVIITEWPDEAAAGASGALILTGVTGAEVELQDLWEPTSRPLPGLANRGWRCLFAPRLRHHGGRLATLPRAVGGGLGQFRGRAYRSRRRFLEKPHGAGPRTAARPADGLV